ncbi:hypothetical protein FRX31_033252, partial [Thalictrum thalictroides]
MDRKYPRSSSSSSSLPNSTRSSLMERTSPPSSSPTPFNSPARPSSLIEQVMTVSSSSSSLHNSTRSSLTENLQVNRSSTNPLPPSSSPTPFNSPARPTSFSEQNYRHGTNCREEEEIKIIDRLSLCSKDDTGTSGTSMKLEPGNNRSKQLTRGQSVRTRRSQSLCETRTDSLPASSELTNTSNYQELVTYNEHEVNQGDHHSVSGDTVSSYGDFEIDLFESTSQHERYFGKFVSGIKRTEFETQLEEWEDAKANKLKNKLRKKETMIDDWELKELTRANSHYREMEERLERKRQETLEKTQKKISSVQKSADAKRLKERQSTTKKISTLSKVVDKLRSIDSQVFDDFGTSTTASSLQMKGIDEVYSTKGLKRVYEVVGSVNGLICFADDSRMY